jgi:hypothetical protein
MTERNWIDAKTKQPDDFESVIVWARIHKADGLTPHEGFLERGQWFTIRGGKATFYEVTHWMPMPEGPK